MNNDNQHLKNLGITRLRSYIIFNRVSKISLHPEVSLNLEPFGERKAMLANLVAETEEWQRAAGGSIT